MLKILRQVCKSMMLLLSVVSWLQTDLSCLLKNLLAKAGDLTGVPSSQNPSVILILIGDVEDFDFLCERC